MKSPKSSTALSHFDLRNSFVASRRRPGLSGIRLFGFFFFHGNISGYKMGCILSELPPKVQIGSFHPENRPPSRGGLRDFRLNR